MRIRSIKPEFWRSKSISCLTIEDRLLFIGLWSYVDDSGTGLDRLSVIAAELFADDLERDPRETFARVSRGLASLSEAGRITRYTVDGYDYIAVTNWDEHQRIDKPAKARYPLPTSANAAIRETVATPSRDCRDTLAPGAGEQRNRGTGDQETSEQQPTVVVPRKRGTRLGADFIPSDKARATALTECPHVDLRHEHAKFVDYWSSIPGQRGVRLDWDATWRNWMRKAAEQTPNGKSRRQQETDDLFTRNAVRMGVNPEQLSLEGRPS